MPRSTSGIAVSIESELVTLPSSPGLRSTLYRGSRLLKRSSCAFPPGCAPGVVLAPGLSSDGCADPRRTFIFSSMYAILEWMSVLYCERRGWRTYICLSTSSAFVCCVKLFARTARRILAALSSGSLTSREPYTRGKRERRTQTQSRQTPARQAVDPPQASSRRRRACVAASSCRLPWSTWTHQCLGVHGEIYEARGARRHCSTRVHVRRNGWS